MQKKVEKTLVNDKQDGDVDAAHLKQEDPYMSRKIALKAQCTNIKVSKQFEFKGRPLML